MSDWLYVAAICGVVLVGMAHYEQVGFNRGARATVIALEPHLCK